MHQVTEKTLGGGKVPVTRVWISKRALKEMNGFAPAQFDKQLERCMENGFALYIGAAVRLEGQHNVYRVGSGGKNFRALGFFEFGNPERDDFIVILAGWKPKKNLLQDWINEVARVRDKKEWMRVVPQTPEDNAG